MPIAARLQPETHETWTTHVFWVVQWHVVVLPDLGQPSVTGVRRAGSHPSLEYAAGRGPNRPGNAATRRPAAPWRGAPGDDSGGLRVG